MNFYDEYKPFRDYLGHFGLVPSLIDIWCYSKHIIEGVDLVSGCAVGLDRSEIGKLKEHIHAWDLDILARELVLNSGQHGTYSLRWWNDLTTVINYLRHLEGAAYLQTNDPQADVMLELHRLAHRQFPWQIMGVNPMMRVFKIFGQSAVGAIVERELGMSTKQFLQLGMAVGGHFIREPGMSTNQNYSVLGISPEASQAFFDRITCNLSQLKTEISSRQSYNQDWPYTWNPLEATPLIRYDLEFPDRVLCPLYHVIFFDERPSAFFSIWSKPRILIIPSAILSKHTSAR